MPEQYPSMFDVQKVDLSVIKDILVRTNSLEALKELEKEINQPELIDIDEAYRFCLLYTSPSPRDGLLSRMPSSA